MVEWSLRTDKRLYRSTALSEGSSDWRNFIFANCSGDNKGFSIVNDEWIEGSGRAFDDSLLSLNEVEDIDCLQRIVSRRTRKPVPARFNELQFVKPCALLAPTGTLSHWFNAVDQILENPFCVAFPNDIRQTVLEMDGSWQTVQAEPSPVPYLERENKW